MKSLHQFLIEVALTVPAAMLTGKTALITVFQMAGRRALSVANDKDKLKLVPALNKIDHLYPHLGNIGSTLKDNDELGNLVTSYVYKHRDSGLSALDFMDYIRKRFKREISHLKQADAIQSRKKSSVKYSAIVDKNKSKFNALFQIYNISREIYPTIKKYST